MRRQARVSAFRLRNLVAAVITSAVAAPLIASGCAREQACIQLTSGSNVCPGRDQALAIMQLACGPVVSVDSEADQVESDMCCYEVSEIDSDFLPCFGVPVPPPPEGGPPGVVSVTTGPTFQCAGLIGGECGACAEPVCCGELLKCVDSSCVDCFQDPSLCEFNEFGAFVADQLKGCMRNSCSSACFPGEVVEPACDALPPGGSKGACVTINNQDVLCNPVTNEGCNEFGAVCDHAESGFACITHPYGTELCGSCGATGWCASGHTCVEGRCARYCCDNSDCGSGHCDTTLQPGTDFPVGVCVAGPGNGTGGAGGEGGAGGAGGTGGAGGMGGSAP